MLLCFRNLLLAGCFVLWGVSACHAQGSSTDSIAAADQPAPLLLLKESSRFSLNDAALVWIDSTARAGLNDAIAVFDGKDKANRPHLRKSGEGHLLHGKAMWLRFTALNLNVQARWMAQLELPTTDLATFYYQRADGSWVEQQAGDSLPRSKWSIQDRYPVFVLSEESARPVTYYLRVAHERTTYSAAINLYSAEEVISSRQVENLLLGLYLGISLAVFVVCLTNTLALRYQNYWRYAVYVATLGLAQLAFLGLGTQYFTPEAVHWNTVASYVMPSFSIVAALWFIRSLIRPARFSQWMDTWLVSVIVSFFLLALLESYSPTMLGYQLSNALTLVSMLTLYLVLLRSWYMGDKNAAWIALGFLPVVIAGLFPLMRNFGLVTTGFLSQYAVTIGSAIEVPILMYALMQRSATQRDLRVREQALRQQDALTGLADERRVIAKAHTAMLRARRFNHRLGLMHVRLSNCELIAKEFGMQTGNAALLIAASHLNSVARDVDLVARLEGPNFLLVFEGPVTGPRLIEAATQLLARSLRPSEALPVGQLLKLQISVALLPDEQLDAVGEDANTVVNWMIGQSETSHADAPNKAIRAINF